MFKKPIRLIGILFFSFILALANLYSEAIAQQRTFLDLDLEFLGEYELTQDSFQDTKIGGLSGITYDRNQDVFYVIADDRSSFAPARFYTFQLDINNDKINEITISDVTFLKNEQGEQYPRNTIDAEAISFSPRKTLFISSEGIENKNIEPFINEYDLQGNLLRKLRIPQRYIPAIDENQNKKGIENNLGFESLTIKANGFMNQEPFRLFTVTESALNQDVDLDNPQTLNRNRLMHYVVNPVGQAILVAEHLYVMDDATFGTAYHGVSELLALPAEGYLLSLERSFGLQGFQVKIFQMVMANASDISTQKSLAGNIDNITPVKKELLLNLNDLNIELDNLEGITLGPKLADGSLSLIVISDNNYDSEGEQKNQILLFKIKGL